MNIIIVGSNCYDLGKELWNANTEYCLIESNNIWDKNYKKYIQDKKTITVPWNYQEKLDNLNKLIMEVSGDEKK